MVDDDRQHSREQYAALGQFVEAFEHMIHEVRQECIELIGRADRAPGLSSIPFHHQVMTAKPLFDIMRAMIGALLDNKEYREQRNLTESSRSALSGSLTRVSTEYYDLCSIRNDLLHGTWYVGLLLPEQNPEEFGLYRYNVTKNGIAASRNLPATASDLSALTQRCETAGRWITTIGRCMLDGSARLEVLECFKHDGDEWICIWPWQYRLPSKSG